MPKNYKPYLGFLKRLAHQAGDIMREHYKGDFKIYTKSDNSKVTDVDLEISELVQKARREEFPEIGLHSEESEKETIDRSKSYFVIDELDGTSYFIEGQAGFSHQAAFYDGDSGQLAVGLVYYPLDDILLYATRHQGAYLEQNGLAQRLKPRLSQHFDELRFAHPARYRGDKYWDLFEDLGVEEGRVVMTTAMRTLQFARNKLDVALFMKRRIPEWDWAGEKVIVEEMGFKHSYLNGQPIKFGEEPPKDNPGYLICPPQHRQALINAALNHLQ